MDLIRSGAPLVLVISKVCCCGEPIRALELRHETHLTLQKGVR